MPVGDAQPGGVDLGHAVAGSHPSLVRDLLDVPGLFEAPGNLQPAITNACMHPVAVDGVRLAGASREDVVPPRLDARVDFAVRAVHLNLGTLEHAFCGVRAFLIGMQTSSVDLPRLLPETVDRRLYQAIHGLPHSPLGDRYVTTLSDLGEGLGWVAAGVALAWLDGGRGRRAGAAATVAALGTTYLVQRMIKPVFRRRRPWVDRDVVVVGLRTTDASFPSGHSASSFAAATTLATFYPKASPLVFALATGVGLSRVHLGHHFPSDVVAGGLVGIATGTLVSWLFRRT